MKRRKKRNLAILAAKRRAAEKGCSFCQRGNDPRWQDYESLFEFLSARSRILPASLSGLCSKHQRKLARVIKQARHLALLPFVTKVE